MQSSLRIGRFGSLTIYLNYTWLLAVILGLWWVALLWLPDNFPGWSSLHYWLTAVAVMLLFLVTVILHEAVHSAVARAGRRSVNLFPFGAAAPFNQLRTEPGRVILAALAGIAFNLLLGGALLFAANSIEGTGGVAGSIRGLLAPLGLLSLWLGLINIIPGVPFDGGWVLGAGISSFGDREVGVTAVRALGGVVSLALMLLGAWVGLTSNNWLLALSLVFLGWAAREAGALGQYRRLLRGAFDQVRSHDMMDSTRPADRVAVEGSVAEMVKAHPYYAPETPLPVVDEGGTLVGLVTLSAADKLLQGTWPSTPVRAITTPIGEVSSLRSDAPLVDALYLAESRKGTELEGIPIPVIDNGALVGSIVPARLDAFENIGQEFGLEETVSAADRPQPLLSRLGSALPAIMVVAAMAILGNIALRTNPADIRDAISPDAPARISFNELIPVRDSVLSPGSAQLSAQLVAPSAITTATIKLDGKALPTELSGSSPLTQTASAQVVGLLQGMHTVSIIAGTESGRLKSEEWQFRVGVSGAGGATPSAVSVPVEQPLQIERHSPAIGSYVLSGAANLPLSIEVTGTKNIKSALLTLDGQKLDAKIAPVAGVAGRYRVSATAPEMALGLHRAHAEVVSATGGFYSSDWAFTAIQPDANNAYFKQTGYFVSQPFLTFWQQNGGLAVFGYPISDRVQETTAGTNETYTAQYFERARFELHAATGDQVVLGRLGALATAVEPPVQAVSGEQFFPQTGHNVSSTFFKFWQDNGGVALFGYPITEARIEKNPVDGKEYKVQYFERNRFELHPDKAGTPFEVQLGQLGTQIYAKRYGG
ncbi:MAG: hypothetical protein IVW55_09965 [Chloroflexi bacterium]|nr:hypothetical protein [Chloroflexota bacterium]